MDTLRPSSAYRWLKCTASPGFQAREASRIPDDTASVYAEEGTEAHEWAKKALNAGPAFDFGLILDEEMRKHVRNYVAWVRSYQTDIDDLFFVEQSVPIFYKPDKTGTVDAAVINPRRLFIGDLKYGAGIRVEAKRNPQLTTYFASLVRDLRALGELPGDLSPDTPVTIGIFQPRCCRGLDDPPARLWETTLREVLTYADEIKAVADRIQADPHGGEFAPSPDGHCRFCPAKGICAAYVQRLLGEFPDEFETPVTAIVPKADPVFPVAESLTVDQVARITRLKDDLCRWLNAVESYAFALLSNGVIVPGLKLVETQKNRAWTDEAQAVQFLRRFLGTDACYTRKVISPAQAEKLLKPLDISSRGKTRFAQLVTRPQGGPTIVLDTDSRPPIQEQATSVFTDISETTKQVDSDSALLL